MSLRVKNPVWGRLPAVVAVVMCALAAPATAQPKRGRTPPVKPVDKVADKGEAPKPDPAPAPTTTTGKKGGPGKEQNFNFEGLGLNGRSRSPQLLYFLERANEELERASLEKRSFIPHMVRSLEEEAL